MEALKFLTRLNPTSSKTATLHQLCCKYHASILSKKPWQHSRVCIQHGNEGQRSYTTATAFDAPETNKTSVLKGTRLTGRSLVLVRGRDSSDLLQGLMTNDVDLLNDDGGQKVIYSMFLNKQGRVLYDVMCYRWVRGHEDTPSFLLECDKAISPELQKHLKLYRIRKKVDITSLDSEYQTWSVFSAETTPPPDLTSDPCPDPTQRVADPRISGLGHRVIIPQGSSVSDIQEGCEEDYCTHRYKWGVAEGVNELPPGETLPLEANLALMHGVSFTKGCYLGQELTARTHHTGVIRKRVMPVTMLGDDTSSFPSGTTIKTSEGKNVGKLRCHLHQNGLALLRTALIGNELWMSSEGSPDTQLEARRPSWWPQEITNK